MDLTWMAGLGAGLQTAGQTGLQLLAQAEERKRQKEAEDARLRAEKRQQALDDAAARERQRAFDQYLFENSLTPDARPLVDMTKPGAAQQLTDRDGDPRDRVVELADPSGAKRRYRQRYAESKEGRAEAARLRAARALQTVLGDKLTPEAAAALPYVDDTVQNTIVGRLMPPVLNDWMRIDPAKGTTQLYSPSRGETLDTGIVPYRRPVSTGGGTPTPRVNPFLKLQYDAAQDRQRQAQKEFDAMLENRPQLHSSRYVPFPGAIPDSAAWRADRRAFEQSGDSVRAANALEAAKGDTQQLLARIAQDGGVAAPGVTPNGVNPAATQADPRIPSKLAAYSRAVAQIGARQDLSNEEKVQLMQAARQRLDSELATLRRQP